MSDPGSSNHYAVLGVERGADLRAIKKAYFALVRKFPPETHAEEFKKIRAAYEVLSDPEARERYDEQEKGFGEFDAEVAAALASAEEAAKEGDDKRVQEALRPLVEARPDVLLLREKLAASLSRTGDDAEALRLVEGLVERSPETARYHHLHGVLLRKAKRMDDAIAELRRACELAPDEPTSHAALVDALATADRTEEALAELDKAEERYEPSSPHRLGIQIRRIDLLFGDKRRGAALDALAALVALAKASEDEEVPKLLATELCATAAQLFAANDVPHANEVLRRCQELHPESPVLHPYPPRRTVPAEALAPEGIAWLAQQQPGPGSPVIQHPAGRSAPLMVAGIGAALLIAYLLLSDVTLDAIALPSQRPASFVGEPAGALFLLALIGVAVVLAERVWRAARARFTSRLERITTIHPLYLVRTDPERVELFSIFCFTACEGVHHRQNGVYTHTRLRLTFDEEQVTLVFHNAPFAQGWLDLLIATRKRALELLAAGYLDAENRIELLPKEVAAAPARPLGPTKAERWRSWARLAAIAAALWGAVLLSQRHHADHAAFAQAALHDTAAAYDWYLGFFPDGEHAADAKRARDRARERAERSLALWLDPRARGSAALARAAAALDRASAKGLPFMMEIRSQSADVGRSALEKAFGKLPEEVAATLSYAGISAARFVERPPDPSGKAAALSVSCDISGAAPSLAAECKIRVLADGAVVQEIAAEISTAAVAAPKAARPDQDAALASLSAAVAARVADELGLGGAHAERRRSLKHTGRSPYDG
jgi:tetratricopeptide (TPR) repeat protein